MNPEQEIYNEIDMECAPDEDDMDSFGGSVEDARPMKTISADITNNGIQIKKNYEEQNQDYSHVNEIDMECNVCEDDDDSFGNIKTENYRGDAAEPKELDTSVYYGETVDDWGDDEDELPSHIEKSTTNKKHIDINSDDYVMSDDVPYDDTEELDSKELVDEDMIEEKKTTTSGKVEDDYWKKLQKQHKATNVKGSYNTHMHFAGDPEAEMADFNAGFSTNGASASGGDTGGDGGCCENLEVTAVGDAEDWTALAQSLLSIVGFSLLKDNDVYILHDDCDTCPDTKCKDNNEIFTKLKPYIEDCFVYPLQIETGEKFTNCKDWCDWYKDENCKKFPKCTNDIKYCDLVANHINDCKF